MSARRRAGGPACRRCGPACRRCSHPRDGHKSYIPGGDRPGYCASCGCYQYRPEHPWTRLLAWMRQPPAPIPVAVLRQHPVPYPVRARYEDRTLLDIRRARPFTADQVGLHVPRQRGGPPW